MQAEIILHPTLFVNVGGSTAYVASCAKVLSTPLDPSHIVLFRSKLLS